MPPPKPALPNEELTVLHQRGVQLETKVRGLLHHGAVQQAQRAFDQDWRRSLLPHLPLRYPFVLERLDRRGVSRLLEVLQKEDSFSLQLIYKVDPHHPDAVGVGLKGEDHLFGFLPSEALEVIDEAGEHADLYEPKILAVRGIQSGNMSFEMELARPDLRQCSACGILHTGDKENCEECRSKRRRKKKSLEETQEAPPVPVSSAFNHLARAAANPDATAR